MNCLGTVHGQAGTLWTVWWWGAGTRVMGYGVTVRTMVVYRGTPPGSVQWVLQCTTVGLQWATVGLQWDYSGPQWETSENTENHGILGKIMKFLGILLKIMKFLGILLKIMKFHENMESLWVKKCTV